MKLRALITISTATLTAPALAADKSTKPRIAVLEFDAGGTSSSSDKPRLAVLEYGESQGASSDKPRIAVIEFSNARERSLARDGRLALTLLDRGGIRQCSFDGSLLADADGTPLLEVSRGIVYAPGSAEPLYTYANDMLVDAAGAQTLLVAEDAMPLGPLELAIAVANRDGYCR